MKWRIVTLAAVFAMALGGVETLGWAQMAREGQMMGPGHGMGGSPRTFADRPLITFMLEQKEELGLSSDQVRSLEAIRSDFQQEAIQRVGEIDSAEAELDSLLKQGQVDLTKVEATVRNIEGLKAALRLDRIKAINQGKSLLSPEQQEKLQTLLEQGGQRPWKRG